MTLNANSYGTVAEVTALTRHLLDGPDVFDEATRPSLSEVESFIDKVSANLNDAIAALGFSVPITAAGPKLSCDSWVVAKAAAMVELTQRSAGFDGDSRYGSSGGRYLSLWNLYEDAFEFVEKRRQAWADQGAAQTDQLSGALTYTALSNHANRSDPSNTTREQPMFRRRMFNG